MPLVSFYRLVVGFVCLLMVQHSSGRKGFCDCFFSRAEQNGVYVLLLKKEKLMFLKKAPLMVFFVFDECAASELVFLFFSFF